MLPTNSALIMDAGGSDAPWTTSMGIVLTANEFLDAHAATFDCPTTKTELAEQELTKALEQWHVYPNPAKGQVTVQSSGTLTGNLVVVDAIGHVVHTQRVNTTHEQQPVLVNVNHLSSGVYWLTIPGQHTPKLLVIE